MRAATVLFAACISLIPTAGNADVKDDIAKIVSQLRVRSARPTGPVHSLLYTPSGQEVYIIYGELPVTGQKLFAIRFEETIFKHSETSSYATVEPIPIPVLYIDIGADGILDDAIPLFPPNEARLEDLRFKAADNQLEYGVMIRNLLEYLSKMLEG